MARDKVVGTYEEIARELYDSDAHPTSAGLFAASGILFNELVASALLGGTMLDVGAGRSILAARLEEEGLASDRVVLLDSSPAMLAHSYAFANCERVIGSVYALPCAPGSVDLLVAALGDPYNTAEFWNEAARVMVCGGWGYYSTPSCEWAERFRSGTFTESLERPGIAVFVSREGRVVELPSHVRSLQEQTRLMATRGLEVVRVRQFRISDYAHQGLSVPPKHELVRRHGNVAVVDGYLFQKR